MDRRLIAIAAAVGIVAGIGLGALLRGRGDATPSVSADRDEIAALRRALDEERAERIALSAEVASLRFAFETLGAMGDADDLAALDLLEQGTPADQASLDTGASATDAGPESPADGETGTNAGGPAEPERPWFDAKALAAEGLPEWEIERLQTAFESHEMEELYLRDQAIRENWHRSKRWQRANEALRGQTREEVGEEGWDWMLYATGARNRVLLDDVLDSSPASTAGFQAGDLVLRYDDQRIFRPRDLQRATARGDSGSTVAVDVLRGDERLRLYLPRGPLGARIRAIRRAPETG